jgi:ankyrin repeat protein
MATTLILAGVGVAARDSRAKTALHHAVAKRSVQLVKLTLDPGANPDVVGKWGEPPRREAERANVDGMTNAFAEAGIKLSVVKKTRSSL